MKHPLHPVQIPLLFTHLLTTNKLTNSSHPSFPLKTLSLSQDTLSHTNTELKAQPQCPISSPLLPKLRLTPRPHHRPLGRRRCRPWVTAATTAQIAIAAAVYIVAVTTAAVTTVVVTIVVAVVALSGTQRWEGCRPSLRK